MELKCQFLTRGTHLMFATGLLFSSIEVVRAEIASEGSRHSAAIRKDWGVTVCADKVVCDAAGF